MDIAQALIRRKQRATFDARASRVSSIDFSNLYLKSQSSIMSASSIVDFHSVLTPSSAETSFEEEESSIESEQLGIFEDPIDEYEVYYGPVKELSPYDIYKQETHTYGFPPVRIIKEAFQGKHDELDLSLYCPDEANLYLIFKQMDDSRLRHIKKLNLSYNQFEKTTCFTLSRYLESSIIEELNLSHCEIGYEGIEILCEGLDIAQHLESVNLSHCNLGEDGGRAIALMLRNNEIIKKINLSHNKLGNLTGIELGPTVKYNACITHLDLSWNDMYPEKGFTKLSVGLKGNKSIVYLDLSWNGLVGPTASFNISKMLRVNKFFQTVLIKNNVFTPSEMVEICQGFVKSKTIQQFYIDGNLLTEDVIRACITGTPNYNLLSLGESYYMSDPKLIKDMQKFKLKYPNIKIIYHGNVLPNPPEPIDFRDIILSRSKVVAEKPKKKKSRKDMGHFMLQLLDLNEEYMKVEDFRKALNQFKAKLDEQLKMGFIDAFKVKIQIGKRKSTRIEIRKMAEKYLAKFPTERPPPPTPKKKKGKKKGGEAAENANAVPKK